MAGAPRHPEAPTHTHLHTHSHSGLSNSERRCSWRHVHAMVLRGGAHEDDDCVWLRCIICLEQNKTLAHVLTYCFSVFNKPEGLKQRRARQLTCWRARLVVFCCGLSIEGKRNACDSFISTTKRTLTLSQFMIYEGERVSWRADALPWL